MKKILFIQTAFNYHQVAIITEKGIDRLWEGTQTRETVKFLMRVLAELEVESIDGLLFLQGPGAFTSLRVGATWVNALAFAKNLPIYTISTLEYVAHAFDKVKEQLIITFDDKRHFFFENNEVKESLALPVPPQAINPDKNKLEISNDLAKKLLASISGDPQSIVDILYVVPPKITLKK